MNTAQAIFEQLKKRKLDLLDYWISDSYREDLHLDFKRKAHEHLDYPDDNDKRNYSKALSGFANSDGGLIIWGIDAPGSGEGLRKKMPIQKVRSFAEHLDSLTSRLVTPQIEEIENYIIFEDKRRDTGYIASYIPKSIGAPHRAEHHSLKKYYQRSGDSFIQLEHWQLEYMFGCRLVPDLKVAWRLLLQNQIRGEQINCEGILNLDVDRKKQAKAILKIDVQNKGKAIAKYSCLRIHFRKSHRIYKINQKYQHNWIDYSGPVDTYFKPSYREITARAHPGLVIYPNDRLTFFEFHFFFNREQIIKKRLPDFNLYFDLFAENIRGITGQKMTIPGLTMTRILTE